MFFFGRTLCLTNCVKSAKTRIDLHIRFVLYNHLLIYPLSDVFATFDIRKKKFYINIQCNANFTRLICAAH